MTRYLGAAVAVLVWLLAGEAQAMYVWVDGQGARHVSTHPRHCFRGAVRDAPECEPIYGDPRVTAAVRRRHALAAAAAEKAWREAQAVGAQQQRKDAAARRRAAAEEECHLPTIDLSKRTGDAFGGFINSTAAYGDCLDRRRLARRAESKEASEGTGP
ncbi:MAG: hypothetical protein ACREXW_01160 [Gammaproteobacteria bacterium]